jgi:CxC2 like cysteine cluster associated with KDZ transposases
VKDKSDFPQDATPNLREDPCGQPDWLSDSFDPGYEDSQRRSTRVRTATSGNPLLTVVNQSGVFDMEVLFCICPNAGDKDEQLFMAGIFPSSLRQIETAFTFSLLDDFLTDNLECKTTAQQYYSKIQSITNRMFPHHVPVCRSFLPLMWTALMCFV